MRNSEEWNKIRENEHGISDCSLFVAGEFQGKLSFDGLHVAGDDVVVDSDTRLCL